LLRWDEREWKRFTTRDGLSSNEVPAIADDLEGSSGLEPAVAALNRLRDGQFTSFHLKDGLPSENISSLTVDEEAYVDRDRRRRPGRLQGGRWTRYTIREAQQQPHWLPVEDGQRNLWIGSIAGLMRVPKKALNDFALGLTTFIPAMPMEAGSPTHE